MDREGSGNEPRKRRRKDEGRVEADGNNKLDRKVTEGKRLSVWRRCVCVCVFHFYPWEGNKPSSIFR